MPSLFDFDNQIDQYAVLGNPISHSKSPKIHGLFAQQTKQKIEYRAIQVDVGGFKQAVGNFFANGGCGLNITVPFKRDAWKLADIRSKRAEMAGAVNTLLMNSDGELVADNTDGIGLVNDLCNNHKVNIENHDILLLGAGGAARGVVQPLLYKNPRQLIIANRTVENAIELASDFSALGTVQACGFDDINQQTFDIIINATSASLTGELPPLADSVIGNNSFCYDMMYGPEDTAFVAWCKKKTRFSVDGLGMLVEQAAESFFIWRGVKPDTQAVITEIRRELGQIKD